MSLHAYRFHLNYFNGNLVTFISARNTQQAIAQCQKTLNHLAPSNKSQWECARATLVEEVGLFCREPTVRATLFEIEELIVHRQYDNLGRLRKTFARHPYHYVLAPHTGLALKDARNELELTQISQYHEVVFQNCNHRPLFLQELTIQQEETRPCFIAT
ncbi:MAG: hypothetical protein A3C02_04105 [Candidatus Andersenbacteria bacterium RIFCSPHIGHO2_02_FULL_45_11]|uniref:Uncharacterized protein n=1 Tax=Candidatus Andersenbacteria bacterium RIFCSPHIGHO2_12_FULL_45_11 TaxID=1797281 RepID=A0A1G1WZ80_9BACT|nr:MAG: hypothetical protein A2805_00815 [Candidatus Andersenbacteria bacterium RIFCSPHIGHO2_01_FULL_46_36]OGY33068.1 MAG: hypothetical protein A3D99_01265 [Candidatus Andersenbacteria bacterium RIFCSPHIGHO2_12_FULL_45_11]OGY33413.1 MAG: hypothetical protein A3C02_04105 [Candidatus Andersenbacteria bacterium RIFCSPHIGHO2_02_FULL_45_11]